MKNYVIYFIFYAIFRQSNQKKNKMQKIFNNDEINKTI